MVKNLLQIPKAEFGKNLYVTASEMFKMAVLEVAYGFLKNDFT